MEKPLLTLKPNIPNAVIPTLIKDLVYSFIFTAIIFVLIMAAKTFNFVTYPTKTIIFWLIIVLLFFTAAPLAFRLIKLHNTYYYFFRTHVMSEFKFIKVKRDSIPYPQIVSITTNISLWDRFCQAGDVILRTAEDKAPDLVLYYIKKPKKIEADLYKMIFKKRR